LQKQNNVNLKSAKIVDGPGLSRYNLLTPEQLMSLLDYNYHNFNTAYEFIASLPIAGIDGTLKERMAKSPARDRVRAKTGTMSQVTALSGYVETKNHKVLGFVIMINGATGHMTKYEVLEDKLCQFLAEQTI